jgi:hypothetical protein
MKLSLASLSTLALIGSASAQYFSAGWTPGQKVQQEEKTATFAFVPQASPTAPAAANAPKATPFSFSSLFDISKILTTEPAVKFFNNFGINITERVQAAYAAQLWDERIELITDSNYEDLIVNEPLTEEEEKDRVWVLVISVTAARQDGVSKYLDDMFDSAFNETQVAGDLPNVKWGRIDYLNVTAITTKWAIWQAPYLVILKDRGQTLRFYRPHHLRLRDDAFREFLKAEGWKVSEPWSTAYAPGGSREYIMDFQAKWITKIYNIFVVIPRWMMVIASGGFASLLIGLLHRPQAKKEAAEEAAKAQAKAAQEAKAVASSSSVASANTDTQQEAPTKRTSARQRKNKK